MKRIIAAMLFLLVISCGSQNRDINKTSVSGVEMEDLQMIDDVLYKYGEDKPYNGKILTKFDNGNISMTETAKNGKIDGETKTYYESGKLKEEYSVKEGKIDGEYKWHSQDGNILITATYKNNEKSDEQAVTVKDKKPFTGTYTETYGNGNVSQSIKFLDGKRDGETIFYYESGKIREKIPYVKGLRDGDYFYYDDTGEVIGKGAFVNDKREGQWLVYDESEKTLIEKIYTNNLEEGPYKVYYEDGKTRAEGTYSQGKLVNLIILAEA